VERIFDTLGSGIGNGIGMLADTGILFIVFALLWVALGAGILLGHGGVDATWAWLRSLPLLVQGVVWLLFLPVALGLWVWESSWPLLVRAIVLMGIAGWNLLVFLPRAVPGRP
jgi:ABC-type amino acid transport system permease subunit